MDNEAGPTFLARHEFTIRRLHSLSGLVPVGGYMVIHLLTNASVLDSTRQFQNRVDAIHSLGAALPLVEWTFIFIPLIFHAVVGAAIAAGSLPNTGDYPYKANIRYTLQRVTAWIALVYIFAHVFHLHGWFKPWAETMGGGRFQHLFATTSAAQALQASVLIQLFYVVGTLSCVYHLANGLWTMGITWGIWTTPAAQRRADYVCIGFGIVLAVISMGAFTGIVTVDTTESLKTEDAINRVKIEIGEVEAAEVDEARNAMLARDDDAADVDASDEVSDEADGEASPAVSADTAAGGGE